METVTMRRTPWWIAAAFTVSVGCDGGPSTNPNEADFPGAPGSRAATPKAVEGAGGGGGGGMSSGDGSGLPSNYPGMGAPKDDIPKANPEEAEAPAPKLDAGAAPGAEPQETPKPTEPTEPKTDPQPAPGR